jgi:hypothetical protein
MHSEGTVTDLLDTGTCNLGFLLSQSECGDGSEFPSYYCVSLIQLRHLIHQIKLLCSAGIQITFLSYAAQFIGKSKSRGPCPQRFIQHDSTHSLTNNQTSDICSGYGKVSFSTVTYLNVCLVTSTQFLLLSLRSA